MINKTEHDMEIKKPQSKYVKFRYEIITTCCAAIFGTLFFGATWWFSGMGKWVVEGAFLAALFAGYVRLHFMALFTR